MTITTAICNSFKTEVLSAIHNFLASGGSVFKLALIKASPTGTYNKNSTNYSNVTDNSDEVSGTGYTAGGVTLSSVNPALSGDTAVCDFADVSWSSASFSADGCIIYNSSQSNKSVSTHDFGGTQTVASGTFSLIFPTPDSSNAILRLA